jgi:hypothetical protein
MNKYRNVIAAALLAASFCAGAAEPRTYEVTFQGEGPVKVVVDEEEDADADIKSQATLRDKPAAQVRIYVRYGQAYAQLTQRWMETHEYTHAYGHVTIPEVVTLETMNPLDLKAAERADFRYKDKAPVIVIARLD